MIQRTAIASALLALSLSPAIGQTPSERVDQCLNGSTDLSIAHSACRELLQNAADLDDDIAGPLYYRSGQLQSQLGLYDEAASSYSQAIDLNHEIYLSLIGRGDSNFNSGRIDEAEADYLDAIDLDQEQSLAHSRLGTLYFSVGYFSTSYIEQSISRMDAAIELDPNNFRSYVLRGLGHFQTGQPELGFSDLDTAIGLADENPALYVIRALYRSNTDDFDDALLDLQLADEIDPDYLLNPAYRGIINLMHEHWSNALDSFYEISEQVPDNGNLRIVLSWISLELGRYADATRECLAAIPRLDTRAERMLTLGGLDDCENLDNLQTALERIEEGGGETPLELFANDFLADPLIRDEFLRNVVEEPILFGVIESAL